MAKPKIAFDLDDVLAESTESWRLYTNQLAGSDIPPEHYDEPGEYWSYYENVWKNHKVDHLISVAHLDETLTKTQAHIRVYTGALRVLRELSETYDLSVVTARAQEQQVLTQKWLDDNYPNIFSELVIGIGRNGANVTKGDICKSIGASWLVDDNVSHVESAIRIGLQGILFGDYGWQKVHVQEKSIVRCKDWDSVEEYFDGS